MPKMGTGEPVGVCVCGTFVGALTSIFNVVDTTREAQWQTSPSFHIIDDFAERDDIHHPRGGVASNYVAIQAPVLRINDPGARIAPRNSAFELDGENSLKKLAPRHANERRRSKELT